MIPFFSSRLPGFTLAKNFIAKEAKRAYHRISRLPSTRYFVELALRIAGAVAFRFPTPTPLPAAPAALLDRLNALADGRFDETSTALADEVAPSPPDPRSYLRIIESNECTSTLEDLRAVSKITMKKSSFLFEIASELLPEAYPPIIAAQKSHFESAKARQAVASAIVVEGNHSYATAREKLENLSYSLSKEIAGLREGEIYHLHVPLSCGSDSIVHHVVEQLGKYVQTGDEVGGIDSIKETLRGKLMQELAGYQLPNKIGNLLQFFDALRSKTLGTNPSRVRQAVFESLEQDFQTLLMEQSRAMNLPETAWEQLRELPQTLEFKLQELLNTAFAQIDNNIDQLNGTMQKVIPPMMQNVMAEQKIFVGEQFAYFVLERKEEGYDLKVYPSTRDPAFYLDEYRGYHSPLHYRNVDVSELNPNFLYRLLSYQAFLREQGVESYSLQHLKEGLLDTLSAKPSGMFNSVDRDFSDQSLIALQFTLTEQAIVNELNVPQTQFDREILEKVIVEKFDIFLKGWSYLIHHFDSAVTLDHVKRLSNGVQALAKDLRDAQKMDIFSADENERINATLWEAAKELRRMKIALLKRQQPPAPSLQIPPELRAKVEEICLTEGSVAGIEIVRNLFVEFLDEDADAALEEVLNELFPSYKAIHEAPPAALRLGEDTRSGLQKWGFESVWGVEKIEKILERGEQLFERQSLLTTYRLFSSVCDFCNRTILGTLLEFVVKAFLAVYFPGVAMSTYLVKSLLDRAVLHGSVAIASALPKALAEPIIAFLELYSEISRYFKKRIATMVARTAFRTIFADHQQMFVERLQKVRTRISREGNLHFNVAPLPVTATVQPEPVPVTAPAKAVETPASVAETSNTNAAVVPRTLSESWEGLFKFSLKFIFDVMKPEMIVGALKNNLKKHVDGNKGFSQEAIIAYFHVGALIYHQATKGFIELNDPRFTEILKTIPYPNYHILQEWAADQGEYLSEINRKRVADIVQFFEEHVPPNSTPWDSAAVVESKERNPTAEGESNFFIEWWRAMNPELAEYLPASTFIQLYPKADDKRRLNMPLDKRLLLWYMLETCCLYDHFYAEMRLQIIRERESDLELFQPILTEANTLTLLEKATAKGIRERNIQTLHSWANSMNEYRVIPLKTQENTSEFITQLIRRMPIPIEGIYTIWDGVEDQDLVLEQIYELSKCIINNQKRVEKSVSLWALYTIAFQLAKQLPECCIHPNDKLDGSGFVTFVSERSYFENLVHSSTIAQMEQLLDYFGVNLKYNVGLYNRKAAEKKTSRFAVELKHRGIRFAAAVPIYEWEYVERIFMVNKVEAATLDFYERFNRVPEIREKLRVIHSASEGAPLKSFADTLSMALNSVEGFGGIVTKALTTSKPQRTINGSHRGFVNLFLNEQGVLPPTFCNFREVELLAFQTLYSLQTRPFHATFKKGEREQNSSADLFFNRIVGENFIVVSSRDHYYHNAQFAKPHLEYGHSVSVIWHKYLCRKMDPLIMYRSDEFLRVLEEINNNIALLKNGYFLDLLLGEYLSLTIALKDNPKNITAIYNVFLEIYLKIVSENIVSHYFSGNEKNTSFIALRLFKMLNIVIHSAIRMGATEAIQLLESHRNTLRTSYLGTSVGLFALVDSYGDESQLLQLDGPMQRQALSDIALMLIRVTYRSNEIQRNCIELFNYWKPVLVDRLNRDPTLVEEVMYRIFGSVYSINLSGSWTGLYPHFTNGTLSINLEMVTYNHDIEAISTGLENTFSMKAPKDAIALQETAASNANAVQTTPPDRLINLENVKHGLELLAWFQPLNDIRAFADAQDSGKIAKIVFPKVSNLTFNIRTREGITRAYNDDAFPGYFIAENQKKPTLAPFGQYLLLQNDRGEEKVIILSVELSHLIINILAGIGLNVTLTAGISRYLPEKSAEEKSIFLASFDEQGQLQAETTESVAYLFLFHFVQGRQELALYYLQQLEDKSRREQLSEKSLDLLEMLSLPLLIAMEAEENKIACRIAALTYENHFLFSNSELLQTRTKRSRIILWVLGQKSYLLLNKQDSGFPLSELGELILLKGLSLESHQLVRDQIPEQIGSALSWCNALNLVDGLLLHPTLAKRYAYLESIHLESNQAAARHVLLTNVFSKAPTQTPAIPIASSSTARTVTGMPLSSRQEFIQQGIELTRAARKFKLSSTDALEKALLESFYIFSFKADVSEAPVELSRIEGRHFSHFFGIYLCYILGLIDPAVEDEGFRDQFIDNAETFRKTLSQLRGNYTKDVQPFVEMLHIIAGQPSLLDSFALKSAYVDNEGKFTYQTLLNFAHAVKQGTSFVVNKNNQLAFGENVREHIKLFIQPFLLQATMTAAYSVITNRNVIKTAIEAGIKYYQSKTRKRDIQSPEQLLQMIPYYNTMMQIPTWYRRGKALYHSMNEIKGARHLHEMSLREAANAPQPSIDTSIAAELKTRDEAVDAVFDYLLQKFFHVAPVPPPEPVAGTSEPQPLFGEESTGRVFDELLQSHRDYHARVVEQQSIYTFTGNPEEFEREFEVVRTTTIDRIRQEREQVVAFANKVRREAAENPSTLEGFFTHFQDLSFDKIFSYIIKGDDAKLMEASGLDEEALQRLKFLVNLHLVACSRWDALFQAFDAAKKASAFNAVGGALAVRRAYSFADKKARIILGFLTFEARTGMVLWKKQADLFERMLLNPHNRQILELIMGSGKTAFGMPFINFYASDKRSFVINIWPKPTAPTNIEEISSQSRKVFNQTSWAFTFSRSTNVSIKSLESFYLTLCRALQESEQINMTKEDLQALLLNFIELLNAPKHSKEDKERILLYSKILGFIKSYGTGNVDEALANFDQKVELNFPIGRKKKLLKENCAAMDRVLNWLMALNEEILIPFKSQGTVQHAINEDFFRQTVSPKLVEKAVDYFNIPNELREEFMQYLQNRITAPSWIANRYDYKEICLVRGMCETLLPFCFSTIPEVDYCFTMKGKVRIAHPGEGNTTPNEYATIQCPYEAYTKTCILYLKNRLSINECHDLIKLLQQQAMESKKKHGILHENSKAARFFARVTGGVNLFNRAVFTSKEVLRRLQKSDAFTLSYVKYFARDEIKYFSKKASSNSHTFGSMLKSFFSCTGTPGNPGPYPEGSVILYDPGTQGECMAIIQEKCGDEPIPILKSTTAIGLVKETLNTFFRPGSDYTSIIERGALFRGLSNDFVAHMMLLFITKNRPDIKGVMFWNSENIQMIWEVGSNAPILFKNSRLLPHERFTYYDEIHTIATDVTQPPTAKAVVTFGEHTRVDGIFQGMWRKRGIKKLQSFTFTTSTAVMRIVGKESITPMGVVEFTAHNTQPHYKKENYENAPKLMVNILKEKFLEKIYEANDATAIIHIFHACQKIFIEKMSQCPIVRFGGLTTKGSPQTALELFRQSLNTYLNNKYFSQDDKIQIRNRLENAMESDFPDEVVLNDNGEFYRSGLGQQTQIQNHMDIDEVQENQEEVEQQQQQQQQQQQNIVQSELDTSLAHWYWPKGFDFYRLDTWFAVDGATPVPIYPVERLCKGSLKSIGSRLTPALYATNNYAPIRSMRGTTTAFAPFSNGHSPLYRVLVVLEGNNTKVLMLERKEAEKFRKYFTADQDRGPSHSRNGIRFALYDIGLNIVVKSGFAEVSLEELQQNEEFVMAIAQAKFLCGFVSYNENEKQALKLWLRDTNWKILRREFKQINAHTKRGASEGKYQGSCIQSVFVDLQIAQEQEQGVLVV